MWTQCNRTYNEQKESAQAHSERTVLPGSMSRCYHGEEMRPACLVFAPMLTIFSTSAGPGTVCLHVTSGSSLKRNKRLKVVALGKQWNTILERVEETEGKLR